MKNKSTDSLIQPSIDNLLTKVENKYVVSTLAAKRAREIIDGDDPLIDTYYINHVTTAINEIDQAKVEYRHAGDEIVSEDEENDEEMFSEDDDEMFKEDEDETFMDDADDNDSAETL